MQVVSIPPFVSLPHEAARDLEVRPLLASGLASGNCTVCTLAQTQVPPKPQPTPTHLPKPLLGPNPCIHLWVHTAISCGFLAAATGVLCGGEWWVPLSGLRGFR